jgi:hypothetical protein
MIKGLQQVEKSRKLNIHISLPSGDPVEQISLF